MNKWSEAYRLISVPLWCEGDEQGGQGRAGGDSQTHHGQESQQRRQDDVTLVPDQRLQPLTELQERETITGQYKETFSRRSRSYVTLLTIFRRFI